MELLNYPTKFSIKTLFLLFILIPHFMLALSTDESSSPITSYSTMMAADDDHQQSGLFHILEDAHIRLWKVTLFPSLFFMLIFMSYKLRSFWRCMALGLQDDSDSETLPTSSDNNDIEVGSTSDLLEHTLSINYRRTTTVTSTSNGDIKRIVVKISRD